MSSNFGMKMVTMINLTTEFLIQLTNLRYEVFFFFFNDRAPPEIYPLSLPGALPIPVSTALPIPPPVSTSDARPVAAWTSTSLVTSRAATALASRPASIWTMTSGGLIADLGERPPRSEEHTSELQSRLHLVCRLLLEK